MTPSRALILPRGSFIEEVLPMKSRHPRDRHWWCSARAPRPTRRRRSANTAFNQNPNDEVRTTRRFTCIWPEGRRGGDAAAAERHSRFHGGALLNSVAVTTITGAVGEPTTRRTDHRTRLVLR